MNLDHVASLVHLRYRDRERVEMRQRIQRLRPSFSLPTDFQETAVAPRVAPLSEAVSYPWSRSVLSQNWPGSLDEGFLSFVQEP